MEKISEKSQIRERRRRQEHIHNHINQKIAFAPIILLLAFVPLIVRLYMDQLGPEVAEYWTTNPASDIFSFYKAMAIITIAVAMVFLFGCYFKKEGIKKDSCLKLYYIGIIIFVLFTILSTVFSSYKDTALMGAPERYEGMMVLVSYAIILVYTIYMINKVQDIKYIIIPIAVLTVVTTILGIFQFIGKDLLTSDLGKALIVPSQYSHLKDSMEAVYTEGKIHGTMFHYNYMGSFGAMIAPLFITLALFLKEKKAKVFCAVMGLCALFLLFGSTSRAGIVGIVVAMAMFLVFFGKKIVSNMKIAIGIVLVVVVFVFGLNFATDGTMFARIPTLVNDIVQVVSGGDKNFNYEDYLPVRDIILDGNKVTFQLQNEQLTVDRSTGETKFFDQNNQEINYVLNGEEYTTTDERFKDFVFVAGAAKRGEQVTDLLAVDHDGSTQFILALDPQGIYLSDQRFNNINYEKPETIGFNGLEKIGSARGYIWSRSLPLVKDTLLLGNGPDTYLMEFPQGDVLGKWYAYDTPWMTVDKPHNLYLQIAINQGVVALIGFLLLAIGYVVHSLKLYGFRKEYTASQIVGTAIAIAIVGYLGAGFFNDSVVSVAPIFWVLLGTGIAVNFINKAYE